jgi:predicted O-methyltransferase YrrM
MQSKNALEYYNWLLGTECDVRTHLPLFHSLPGRILEIGVRDGCSTAAFLSGASVHVTSIDIDPKCAIDFNDSKWTFICGDSRKQETYDRVRGCTFDVLYIDGSHEYEDVKNDLWTYLQIVSPGGVILMHDVLAEEYPGVWRAFNDFRPGVAKYIRPGSYGLGVIEV